MTRAPSCAIGILAEFSPCAPIFPILAICWTMVGPPRLGDLRIQMRRPEEPRGWSSLWKMGVAASSSLTGCSQRPRVSGRRMPWKRTSRSGTRRAGSAYGDPRDFCVTSAPPRVERTAENGCCAGITCVTLSQSSWYSTDNTRKRLPCIQENVTEKNRKRRPS